MLMKISPDLSRQEIWAERNELISVLGRNRDKRGRRIRSRPYNHEEIYGDKRAVGERELVAEIENPILLTNIPAICALEPTRRENIMALLQSYPRTVEYDGVSVTWDPERHINVWGPTIDTVVYASAIRTAKGVLTERVTSAIDVGTGSGFLAKYALHKCKNIRELHMVDLNPYAIKCAKDNVRPLHRGQVVRAYVADGRRRRSGLGGKRFDRVFCSPPYVPRPKSIEDNPYEGVGLLHDMIVNGRSYVSGGGMLVLTTSSLSAKIREAALTEGEEKGGLRAVEEIGKKYVPLKVNPILNNPDWMAYLLGEGLDERDMNGYKFWHTISVLKLQYE